MKNLMFSLILLFTLNIVCDSDVPKNYKYIKPKFAPLKIKPSRAINKCTMFPNFAGASTPNWAGYVASTNIFNPIKGTVTFVKGSWIIPTVVQPPKDGTYYAIWVGIDGFNSGTIEQLGTAYQFTNGKQINYAWFEMFPKVSMQISNFPVKPGDSITAIAKYEGSGQYTLKMFNNTRKTFTVVPASHTRSTVSPRTSCEWIVEAPSDNKGILPLAHFNPVTFTKCEAIIKGIRGKIKNPNYQNIQINMANSNGTVKAVTSALNSTGDGFKVVWKHV